MNFYATYLRSLFWKPQDAIVAMYWWCTGRKVRARNRLRMVARQSPFAYQLWIETIEREQDQAAAAAAMARWPLRPRISVILHQTGSDDVPQLLAALSAQWYPDWELVVVRDGNRALIADCGGGRQVLVPTCTDNAAHALALGIEQAGGAYVLPLPGDSVLPARALFRYVEALQSAPGASVLYGDHDQIDTHGNRSVPWFKPRWNAEMFLAQDYLSAACLIRTDAARRALPIAPELADAASYALLLAVTAAPEAQIAHVPYVLNHTRDLCDKKQSHKSLDSLFSRDFKRKTGAHPETSSGQAFFASRSSRALGPANQAARLAAVTAHVAASGATARAGPFGTVAVSWPLPHDPPLVSIIVPTRDHARLLRACLTSVLGATLYHPYEILIVDNGSVEPETLAYLAGIAQHPGVRVLRYDHPYNYSAINNFAAGHARGEYLCLLNNDTEVQNGNWLTELMRQAVRPQVGAAGAKLLYGDGTIQHAGVVIGLGGAAGHAHRYQRGDDPGYFARAHVAHYASAVTAACLVVKRAKFDAVGGLDEVGLPIAFNDVDLCLKLEQAGWRNVYVPQAVLLHHESKSRGKDFAPAHMARYRRELAVLQERWGTRSYHDPLHHPNLDRSGETYVVRL